VIRNLLQHITQGHDNLRRDIKNNIYIYSPVYTPLMSKMRGLTLSVLTFSLVVGLVICTGCIFGSPQQTLPTNNTTVNDTGVVPITMGSSLQGRYSLNEAETAIAGVVQANMSSQDLPVYSVLGKKADISGNAESWILGIRSEKSSALWVYDRNGISSIAWNGTLPDQEIQTGSILSPEKAIARAYPDTQNTTGYFTVEISSGEYVITESEGATSPAYRINATTGELITAHD